MTGVRLALAEFKIGVTFTSGLLSDLERFYSLSCKSAVASDGFLLAANSGTKSLSKIG